MKSVSVIDSLCPRDLLMALVPSVTCSHGYLLDHCLHKTKTPFLELDVSLSGFTLVIVEAHGFQWQTLYLGELYYVCLNDQQLLKLEYISILWLTVTIIGLYCN